MNRNYTLKDKIFLFIATVIFCAIGVYYTFVFGNPSKYDSNTHAFQITAEEGLDSDNNKIYYPVYHFHANGKIYTCKAETSRGTASSKKNDMVYYDSKNPNNCLAEIDTTSNKFLGVVFLACGILLGIALLKGKPIEVDTGYDEKNIDPRKQEQIMKNIEKTMEIVNKVQLLITRIVIGIIILILLVFIIIDLVMIKQTIKSRNYIETTATCTGELIEEESDVFDYYKYTFIDNNGNVVEIEDHTDKENIPEETIQIRYNKNNPQDYYYVDGSIYTTTDYVWFAIKLVIMTLLIILFFNTKLLSRIHVSTGH